MSANDQARLEVDSLSALKSSFAFPRRARPPLVEVIDPSERTPLGRGASKLARRESRGGLRSIFGRSKSDVNLTSSLSVTTEDLPTTFRPETAVGDQKEDRSEQSPAKTPMPPEKRPGIRMTMRSKTAKTKAAPKTGSKPIAKASTNAPRRTSATWDPPPLFQAYPQAIKHAQLASTSMSADSIIRISNHRRNGSLREDIAQTDLALGADEARPTLTKKSEKAKSKHRRQVSGSLSKAQWTEKIYVLVTSGYLLQYAGSGSFDRLPEKMMQLGKDSVAFASDVIPGKHWVLQISQAMETDGTPSPDVRSLLSRLSFRNADYRRTATSFLLVLPSAEELESWIAAVRREIEALGGKKCVTETGKPKVDADVVRLKSQPSQRYLIQRDPDRFSNAPTSRNLSPNPVRKKSLDNDRLDYVVPIVDGEHMRPPSAKRISIATSLGSSSSHPLDSVKDASFRLSYMSSGQRTLVTSQGSSPTCSPTRETFGPGEESRPSDTNEGLRSRVSAAVISERRRTMQMMQSPRVEYRAPPKTSPARPHSTYGGPGRTTVAPSVSTPNFSIPHAVSKRYTLAKLPDSTPTPIAELVKSTVAETASRGVRKSPPGPLRGPSLSPVEDQPSPIRHPTVYIPTRPRPSTGSLPSHDGSDASDDTSRASTEPSHSPRPSIGTAPGSPDTSIPSASSAASFPPLPKVVSGDAKPAPRALLLPALPVTERNLTSRLSMLSETITANRNSYLPPLDDARTSSKSFKPRRPTSMQVLSRSPPISYTNSGALSSGNVKGGYLYSSKSAVRSSVLLPAFQAEDTRSSSPPSIQARDEGKNLLNRRSMPQLVNGPPPAPPPSCALPPIPPGGARAPSKESRNSVRV